jgi:hypothetical protein
MNPILKEIRNDLAGLGLLHDWLGTGEPVHPVVSYYRAKICEDCPENVQPGWWDTHIKLPIAQTIKAELELKSGMKISVPNEAAMGMCKVCGCCNALAVHVPVAHLKDHTSQKLLARFPDNCWKKREISASIAP